MRVLIIEDEPLAQDELVRIITKRFPQMQVVAKLASVEESVAWLKSQSADLIFMDIQLSDGISFDIFEEVEVRTPILFTTAYDEYAIRAFQVNGIGYLLKPIDEQGVVSAVEKLDYSPHRHTSLEQLLQQLAPSNRAYKTRIALRLGDRYSYLDMSQVAYFYAEDRVTFVVPKEGRKQLVDTTIEILESQLDPSQFFKISRGCIASIGAISGVSKYFNSRLKVTLTPPIEATQLVSRVRVPEFLKWLDGE